MIPASFAAIPERFWRHLAEAPAAALLLDYDGTLAPFVPDPARAIPYEGVRELLQRIDGGKTRVVLVSGRPAREVRALLRTVPPLEVWGEHGGERLLPDGTQWTAPLLSEEKAFLDRAGALAADHLPSERIERKQFSLAVHVRGISGGGALLETLRRLWEDRLSGEGWRIRPFAEGLEVRRADIHKGRAVCALLEEVPPGVPVACAGDDETDEDAFRALGERGLSLLVSVAPRCTAAKFRLFPPEEVLAFLRRWHTAAEESGAFPGDRKNPSVLETLRKRVSRTRSGVDAG
jgi:trehalose 6-phosphate synthase/trehalose 6-phosphate phosphatase